MHQLERDKEKGVSHTGTTVYGQWTRSGEDLVRSGIVELEADGATAYGLTVCNRSPRPLFVWVFYFDCSNLSISKQSIFTASALSLMSLQRHTILPAPKDRSPLEVDCL